jgi:hypothetical protein
LKETVRTGTRKQDPLNSQKYRYTKEFDNLPASNTHIVAIVLFGLHESESGEIESNNFIATAYRMFRKTPAFRRGDVRNGFDFDFPLYSEYLYNTLL